MLRYLEINFRTTIFSSYFEKEIKTNNHKKVFKVTRHNIKKTTRLLYNYTPWTWHFSWQWNYTKYAKYEFSYALLFLAKLWVAQFTDVFHEFDKASSNFDLKCIKASSSDLDKTKVSRK